MKPTLNRKNRSIGIHKTWMTKTTPTENITYFKISNSQVQELTDTAIIGFLKNVDSSASDAFPSRQITKYLKPDELQAFFFKDGTVFFAKVDGLNGAFLANVSHVWFMQVNPAAASPTGTRSQTSLALAKPEQFAKRTANDLMYWQNMQPDSKVVQAINAFEKQNPH